ncbi:MAG: hypothetical protein A2Z95_02620 [Gallionellales bacterium GWA2_60_18]|nr:MAG: hypothetical protein A2Z95_02620 [Gallionellales bacterium GWA2_60_18]
MSDYISSPLGKLEGASHLLSPVCKGPTKKAGRFGFRGEIAVQLAESTAGEMRPPKMKIDQVFMTCEGDKITFYASFLDNVADLAELVAIMKPWLSAEGKFFIYAGNVDLLKKYQVEMEGATFNILPLDEGTVYNEILDLLYLEKGDLKKASMEEKLDILTDTAKGYKSSLPVATFAKVVGEMGAVKVAENRPV